MTQASKAKSGQLSVLVIDDDQSLRKSIGLNLENAGYQVVLAADGLDALSLMQRQRFQIVLCDLKMPRLDGLQFITRCKAVTPEVAIVLMTGFGSDALALEAISAGAYDYISKPFSVDQLLLVLRKLEIRKELKGEAEPVAPESGKRANFPKIIAKSQIMQDIFETVHRLANYNTTVLIVGESGTGKELIAQALHHHSPRKGKAFIAINCGAIPEHLMESELFGHKKGAFTDATVDKVGLFEEANGGTIFLDEIGEMPLHLQVKLLRALQEQQIRRVGDGEVRTIDVRVVAATLRNLEDDVRRGRFRDDLFYRLNVVTIDVPPLRDRPEDIPALIQHFLKKHNKRLNLKIQEVEPPAMKCLLSYHWRGNVRELENCIERAMVLSESNKVDLESLPPQLVQDTQGVKNGALLEQIDQDDLSVKKRTRALEMQLILKALERTGGNRTHAAKILEISHRALLYKLKEYGIGKETEG